MDAVVGDDHILFREAIAGILVAEGYRVTATDSDGDNVRIACRGVMPDMLVVDLRPARLGGGMSIGCLECLEQEGIRPRTVVITGAIVDCVVYAAERIASIRGVMSKAHASVDLLQQAIRTVASGGRFFCSAYTRTRQTMQQDPNAFPKVLSDKQVLFLRYLAHCEDDIEIATEMGLSLRSVEGYRSAVMRKLGVKNAAQLVRFVLARGFDLFPPRRGMHPGTPPRGA